VVDGSFANYTVRYYDMAVRPHCISRGFIHHETQELGKLSGWHLRPEAMGELARAPDYQAFEEVVEGLAHNALHWGIRGDFGSWAAANDPIFFLHHAQLDRLWWTWQQEDPKARLMEYEGKAFNVSSERARLHDGLGFGGLKELAGLGKGNVSVASVMDAAGGCGCGDDGDEDEGLLCYRY
jgi:tyrosinase